jgi:hypothetical protein
MNLFPIGGRTDIRDGLILNEIRPFAKRLLDDRNIKNFHFLIEPEIRFRLYGEPANFKPQTEQWLKGLKDAGLIEDKSDFNDEYKGEEEAAGKVGQEAYYAYMKAGSEIAFVMLGKKFEKPTNFYHYRGFHFLLNSCGFNTPAEINFYINEVLPERLQTFKQQNPTGFQKNKAKLLTMIGSIYSLAITL